MDHINAYIAVRCLLLAEALRRLPDLPPEAQAETVAEAAGALEVVGEVMAELGGGAGATSRTRDVADEPVAQGPGTAPSMGT